MGWMHLEHIYFVAHLEVSKYPHMFKRVVVCSTSRVSLQAVLYMTQEDQVFVTDVVIIDSMQKTMASSIIS
jgi:hypothetical protein